MRAANGAAKLSDAGSTFITKRLGALPAPKTRVEIITS